MYRQIRQMKILRAKKIDKILLSRGKKLVSYILPSPIPDPEHFSLTFPANP